MTTVDVRNKTRRATPRFAYTKVADAVLPGWTISLAFLGPKEAQALNVQLRQKDYTPNVLSYEAGEKHGEILICLAEAQKQAPAHGMDMRTFVLFLFIHGLLHLKGMPHGATMERREKELVARFVTRGSRAPFYDSTNRNRN